MKINVNFNTLLEAVHRMGAKESGLKLASISSGRDLEFDTELSSTKGIEIQLSDVDTKHGLLSYKGRQILLYIPDHDNRLKTERAIENGSKGKKFHVCDCRTLEDMRNQNRYERYTVTNNLSGLFFIYGGGLEGETELNVCYNCMEKLNYKSFCNLSYSGRWGTIRNFNMEEFFSKYSSIFRYLPKFRSDKEKGYTEDWKEKSIHAREKAGFICQHCSVNLSQPGHRGLLHGHHKNGVKSDNSDKNLIALCADCHRKEPYHEHMHVSRQNIMQINALRREQGLLNRLEDWKDVYKFADPALHGVLNLCQQAGEHAPEVGYEIRTEQGEYVTTLDIAWPNFWIDGRGLGVSLGEKENLPNWEILDLSEALKHFS
ncbi:hypothetical protein NX722_26080 [Endozoicomonas gorgoniicola]|uniref:HNH endonuclease n=1 Tax=Endozoicomonas gorgoniicola TaxID=1234144 RepID=A0ABT3N4A1_9GAMM|nr:hypothetical protein [Endozoicomonas gorgoniicola]MCW7556034.1 hypothetical protein [Endozoicomonas gorgoniicola]